ELVLAYATTIHKSQGSEYPAVVIPLSTQHYPTLRRNLVYTGATRGKRLVVLLGQRKALAIAVKGSRAKRRWSKLREWLMLIGEHVYPNEEDLFAQVSEGDRWQPVPLLESLKARARAAELWNLFLPESQYGAGLTNLEYAPLCETWAALPGRRRCSIARRRIPAIWKSWSAMARWSSASVGSIRCSPAKSARPLR